MSMREWWFANSTLEKAIPRSQVVSALSLSAARSQLDKETKQVLCRQTREREAEAHHGTPTSLSIFFLLYLKNSSTYYLSRI